MTSTHVFPFGQPGVTPLVSARPARVFVLGAYPSALHIRWVPPKPLKPIRALAVDVEPEPFWNGADEIARVEAWKVAVGWQQAWGAASPVGRLNGPSGLWVDEQVLAPLGASRAESWITDCLHWYCASVGGAARIADTYRPFAVEAGLPEVVLPPHPSESGIVRAAELELDRLRVELGAATPTVVVTLGNAALRVSAKLLEGQLPKKLNAGPGYGAIVRARFEGRDLDVLPLAHPAAPKQYQEAHRRWVETRRGKQPAGLS